MSENIYERPLLNSITKKIAKDWADAADEQQSQMTSKRIKMETDIETKCHEHNEKTTSHVTESDPAVLTQITEIDNETNQGNLNAKRHENGEKITSRVTASDPAVLTQLNNLDMSLFDDE